MVIPLLQPHADEDDIQAVVDVLRSGWWGQGPVVEQFETELADRLGYAQAVTMNSATAALKIACTVAGVGPGTEVITTPLTFISTAAAVIYNGAKVVFADVDPDTLCIDWADVRRKLTPKTRAVIPVDLAGHPAAETRPPLGDVTVIQDAAHSIGGFSYGDLQCVSFHPVKPVPTGDGGALLTNSVEWATRARALRWLGIGKSTWDRSRARYNWQYEIQELGDKCHWNDIFAALALSKLKKLGRDWARRQAVAERYGAELRGLVTLPATHPRHRWHLYVVRVPNRDQVAGRMLAQGISVGVHYQPLTYYTDIPGLAQPCPPVVASEWPRLLSLPIYPHMTVEDQDRVIAALRQALL